MEKVEEIVNEIDKLEKYKSSIVFFFMDKYVFLFRNIDVYKQICNYPYTEGTLQGLECLRLENFDPNDLEPFNSILKENKKPMAVKVQPEYWIEDEFIQRT